MILFYGLYSLEAKFGDFSAFFPEYSPFLSLTQPSVSKEENANFLNIYAAQNRHFNFGPIRDSNLIPFLLGWKFLYMNFDMRRTTYMKLMLAYVSVYIAYTQLKIDIFNFGRIRDSNLIPF